jgi:hypothetical protein
MSGHRLGTKRDPISSLKDAGVQPDVPEVADTIAHIH